MKIREVIILPQVRDDLAEIIEFITFNTSEENALRYADDLIAEINQLSYLADAMAVIPSKTLAQYHPLAQRLLSNNRKWCIIFHKTDKFVFVHKIMPSRMVIM
jgi:hypothetical protein